ncbi:hypothetical protein P8452_45073 [Trifolium repens]|nr:hypothetical protein P8452_45073 [Trifolium repens]
MWSQTFRQSLLLLPYKFILDTFARKEELKHCELCLRIGNMCFKKYVVQSDWKALCKMCGTTMEYKCDCGIEKE